MLDWVEFENYRCLRQCRLQLDRLNLLVGPNGSGKSTVLEALGDLQQVAQDAVFSLSTTLDINELLRRRTVGSADSSWVLVRTAIVDSQEEVGLEWSRQDERNARRVFGLLQPDRRPSANLNPIKARKILSGYQRYLLQAKHIGIMQAVDGKLRLAESGANLASVLDALRDRYPERFEMFNEALTDWFPEFDKVLFEVPGQAGLKAIALRTRDGQYSIPVTQLSDGTRLALALLTLAWLPEPPTIVGIEEPDRGIHPRLLHKVHDALVRLAYPEQFGEERPPVQVIATTHSPYLVDLFKDHPEHVVIANKTGLEVTFRRLSESDELLQELDKGPSLGEIWFSGLLGGVP